MMFTILGLAFLNFFTIGLALHTLKFDIHHNQILQNIFTLFAMIGIMTGGVFLVVKSEFPQLMVNPVSLWDKGE